MGAARYEVLSSLPPGGGTRTRLAWQTGDVGFLRPVVLREVPEGAEVVAAAPANEGVLPLLDMVELEGKRWAVYEFVPGATFAEVSAAHFAVERLPSLGLIGRVVVDACRAIQRVHAWVDPFGLAGPQKHGGLSDASVFIGFDGVARVLDLNARRLSKFVAPEQTRGDAFDARADIFSLGALLHHATTRFDKGYAVTMARAPSTAEFPPPSAIHPEATLELDAVVIRALMPSASSRFASAAQLAEEIEKVLGPILFTHQQVNSVLVPLFGDRMRVLRDLVDPKKRPPAPRASAPRPSAPPRVSSSHAQRTTGNALDAVSARDVKLDGEALGEIADIPTQANIALPGGLLKPGPPVPDYDPHATTPGRSLIELAPRLAQTSGTDPELPNVLMKASRASAEDKARAKGQEKITTAELEPDQMSPELRALQGAFGDPDELEEPTNIKPRPSQVALAALKTSPRLAAVRDPYEDPKKKESTMEVDPADASALPARAMGRASKIQLAVLALAVIGGGAAVGLNLQELKARLRPPPAPATFRDEAVFEEVVLLEDGGVSTGEPIRVVEASDAEEEGDGGEDEEGLLLPGGTDAGRVHDGGTTKHPAPVHKKKKKRRNR